MPDNSLVPESNRIHVLCLAHNVGAITANKCYLLTQPSTHNYKSSTLN